MSQLELKMFDDAMYGNDFNRIVDALNGLRTGIVTIASAGSGARWVIDPTSIRCYDTTNTNYGAPSGAGVIAEFSSNGSIFLGGPGITIQSNSTGPRLTISSTLIDINDGTYDRAQLGLLSSYTDPNGVSSPAGYGGRFLDANGNIIFDTVGIAQTMKLLVSATGVTQGNTTGNGSFQTVTSSQVSFTLSRQTRVLILGAVQALDPTVGDTGFTLSGAMLIDGAFNASNGPQIFSSGSTLFVTPFACAVLAAGNHTAACAVEQTTGKLWATANNGCYIYVFALGSI